ncbi:hypothetical protein CFK37_07040 [Virgibacillus phasianinus]|uniref:DUF4097 domain-containing protein n=1 Tax=Virgibacillus phasianinus TaxID=2017483 RepID=A0A220U265_9BACI|nr:DUF4097 family beta strand repeat-containing protein [Virgibacillus phasianinus]ASK61931.1 hypothetical protein CFK37_07040 [Virgibacillus phasianinus]
MTGVVIEMALFGLNKNAVQIDQKELVRGELIESLNISTSSADIELLSGNNNEIGILLQGEMSEKLAEDYEFKINQKMNRLDISFKTNNRSSGFQFGSSYSDVKLQITLPEKVYNDVQVQTSSGDITINNVYAGTLSSRSSSGDQTISGLKIRERLFVKSSSGDIEAKDSYAGGAKFHASSGSIKLKEIVCNETTLETSSGDAVYQNETISGSLTCKASSGDVTVHVDQLPESIGMECRANSGGIKVNIDGLEVKEKTDHLLIASKGTEGSKVHCRTSSGDIKVY